MKLSQRMTKATARGVIAVAGLALLLGATAASANPITSFTYTSNVGFYNWTQTHTNGSTSDDIVGSNPWSGVVPSQGTATPPNGNGPVTTKLAWGDPSNTNQSSLELNPANFGMPGPTVIPDSGVAAPSGSVTHNNFVITGDHLTSATILGLFSLTAATPSGNTMSEPVPFYISFDETTNEPSGKCAQNADGTYPAKPCPDIFVLNNSSILTQLIDGSVFGSQFADTDYLLTLGTIDALGNFSELPTLSDAQCLAAHAAQSHNCRGFITTENASTTINLGFTITTVTKVPEPMPIALFGLGLLALGVMLRRRRRTDHAE